MVFNRKGSFFLNLDDKAPTQAAQVAPMRAPEPEAKAEQTATPVVMAAIAVAVAAADPSPATPAPAPSSGVTTALTTAEAIAAELRAAQEARPATVEATFAPDCLNPANAVPSRRRRAGANLAGFKAMAASMVGK